MSTNVKAAAVQINRLSGGSGTTMPNVINHHRRLLLGMAATSILGAQAFGLARANASSFGPLKQVQAGVLDIGYVEAGPADGPAVILLHGWPYDIHSFAEVTPPWPTAG